MRTFDDTFSGEKIYPGKVRLPNRAATPSPRPPKKTTIPDNRRTDVVLLATLSGADCRLT